MGQESKTPETLAQGLSPLHFLDLFLFTFQEMYFQLKVYLLAGGKTNRIEVDIRMNWEEFVTLPHQ